MQSVTVAILQIRELENKQVRSFPKVTLTANEEVGERVPHILKAVSTRRYCTCAQGRGDTEHPCLLCGLLLSSWQVGSMSVQSFASGIQCTDASPATADLGITLVRV